jgi:hypothetical protein
MPFETDTYMIAIMYVSVFNDIRTRFENSLDVLRRISSSLVKNYLMIQRILPDVLRKTSRYFPDPPVECSETILPCFHQESTGNFPGWQNASGSRMRQAILPAGVRRIDSAGRPGTSDRRRYQLLWVEAVTRKVAACFGSRLSGAFSFDAEMTCKA